MANHGRPLKIGPLFARDVIVEKKAEKIIDDNDHEAAEESVWLKNYSKYKADLTSADSEFFEEYGRRKA